MPLRAALASTAHARQAHAATAHAAYADTATATAAAMLAPPLPSATLEPTHLLREGMATRWRPQQSQDGGLLGSRVWRDDAAMRSVTSFVAGYPAVEKFDVVPVQPRCQFNLHTRGNTSFTHDHYLHIRAVVLTHFRFAGLHVAGVSLSCHSGGGYNQE